MGMPAARIPGSSRAGFAGTIEGKPSLDRRPQHPAKMTGVETHALEDRPPFLVEDCCAAGTQALHEHELQVLNRIYCHVLTSPELRDLLGLG